ncbi:MAG: PD-(D/E)XK nuclease family protein [Elusimicrobia bacterium]|nr:PD-(D/E)XK nuclease family protein [Elusimicrobiota bacterium]
MSTYEGCPQRYKFRYLDRIKTEEESLEAFLGKRVHEALEKLYRDLTLTKLNSLDELSALFETQWERAWHDQIRSVRKEFTPGHYFQLGIRCLKDYYETYTPFNQGTTLGLEERVEIQFQNGERIFRLRGYVDRLTGFPNGVYEIHDYKTSSTLPSQSEIDQDPQLALYQLGLMQRWTDIREVRLVWHYLVFNKELTSRRTVTDLEGLQRQIIQQIHQIETDAIYTPRQSGLCNWCEYRSICPLWKHEARVEALPINAYLAEPGVQLVKRYAQLEAQQEELARQLNRLETERAQLDEAVLAYADRAGVSVLSGGDDELRIETTDEVKAPTKRENPQAWMQLTTFLKHAGKWEEVSYLSWQALARVLRLRLWAPELLLTLSKFVSRTTKRQVRLLPKRPTAEGRIRSPS